MNGYRVAQRGSIGYTASAWTITDQEEFDRVAGTLRPERTGTSPWVHRIASTG